MTSPAVRRLGAAVAVLALILAGCAYRLAGTGPGVLPPDVKALVVAPFENRTTRPEIEQRVTEEVARELSQRGRYKVVTDLAEADAILEGAITRYTTTPVQFSASALATRLEAVVVLQASVRNLTDDQILWSQDGLIFREQFDIPEGEDFTDQESLALDDIAQGAAGALVTSIFEEF
jgi:hypothetical protein